MAKAPFNKTNERASELLTLIHTDVCGLFRTSVREGYFTSSCLLMISVDVDLCFEKTQVRIFGEIQGVLKRSRKST